MLLTLPSPLYLRCLPTLCDANMKASSRAQMLAGYVVLTSQAGAMTEPFVVIPHEEINRVLCARLAVRDAILAEDACGLHEQVA